MNELTKKAEEYCTHISEVCLAPCSLLLTDPVVALKRPENMSFCEKCRGCEPTNTMHYGCSEAYRWNGKYVSYCPKGLIMISAALTSDNNALCGGLVVGPVIMGDMDDTLQLIDDNALREEIKKLPVFTTERVRHIEEILSAVAGNISGTAQSRYGNFIYEQDKLLSRLYEMKTEWQSDNGESRFLIDSEKKLSLLIANKDKEGAQQLLNEMLGYLFFSGKADFKTIKARLIEMLVLLSRLAIDAGAGIEEILLFNEEGIKHIEEIDSIEELSSWITVIMHRFIQYSFDFTGVKHSDVLYKIIQYVKANYNKKITLDDIASNVYLSRSYISSMFKEEMGEGLVSYINKVRVEKSKLLLLNESVSLVNVGGMCGFEDQSYFTKVFKSIVGVSPKRYRDCRGNITTQSK